MSTVIIVGAAGALGKATVSACKEAGFKTAGVDIVAGEADVNVTLATSGEWDARGKAVVEGLKAVESVVAVVCVAGGWAGGNVASEGVFNATDRMYSSSVQSSVLAGHLAAKYMGADGLLVFTGAEAARGSTAGMVGYGLAKAAVHHLTTSLASSGSGLPDGTTVAALLPVTLDTPANRAGMPKADFSTWTPLAELANKIVAWVKKDGRPKSGALVSVKTEGGKTSYSE